MAIWGRLLDYRRAQRERMQQLRSRDLGDLEQTVSDDELLEHTLLESTLPLGGAASTSTGTEGDQQHTASTASQTDSRPAEKTRAGNRRDFGIAGSPLNRQSPFFVGFVGALGVLVAYAAVQAISQLGTVITLLVISFFLTLSLNPLVEALTRWGLARGWSVAIVSLGFLGVLALILYVVIPPVATQSTELANNAPGFLSDLLKNPWVQDMDHRYQVIAKIQEEVDKRVADGNLWVGVFGGVLDIGKVILSGVFGVLTVFVLTLYFLSALPSIKHGAYSLVPASRRPRVMSLSEEIMRRVGSYAIGQVCVAAINAFCAWILMTLIDLRFAAVLAVAVGLLGLIPMVGATLGASVVALVAFFDEPKKALIVIVYFVIYQQIENYAVMPRIMQRTVSVPGVLTVVAALIGGTLGGIVGALLAIPVAAGLLLLYDEVLVPRQRQH